MKNIEQAQAAGVFKRLAAMVYDSLLLAAITMAYFAIAVSIHIAFNGAPEADKRIEWGHWNWLVFFGWLITMGSFYVFCWRKSGQTLGMKAWRMRLVDEQLNPPSLKQCILRAIIAPFSLLCFGVGYIYVWFNKNQQTLHDKITKTQVVMLAKEKK